MKRLLAVTIGGSLAIALVMLWLLGSKSPGAVHADPGTRYVAPGGNCSGATPCYATIQAAVDAAGDGDEIRVAAGTYAGAHTDVVTVWSTPYTYTQVVIITKTLAIRGGFTPANWTTPNPAANITTIDAQRHGRGVTVAGDGTQSVAIEGGWGEGHDQCRSVVQRYVGGVTCHPCSPVLQLCCQRNLIALIDDGHCKSSLRKRRCPL